MAKIYVLHENAEWVVPLEAAFREQRPVLAVPVGLVEKQRAKLGVPRVIVGEKQRRRDRVHVERARRGETGIRHGPCRHPRRAHGRTTMTRQPVARIERKRNAGQVLLL